MRATDKIMEWISGPLVITWLGTLIYKEQPFTPFWWVVVVLELGCIYIVVGLIYDKIKALLAKRKEKKLTES